MNKFLRLSLIALLAVFCGEGAFAQEVTLDFTTNNWGLPVGSSNKGTTAQDFSNGTYTITLQAADGYYYNTSKYLMLGKKNSTLTLPAFTFDVEKIEVVGNKGASASVVQNIYVGDEAVSTATTGAGNTSAAITNTYIIADGKQAAGTIYTLKITSAHNTQITTINIYKKTATSKSAAGLTFSESNISIKKGETFTAPTFTKSTTADVTFASDNEGVATVNAEGVISLGTEVGTAVITATSVENNDFYAGTATCTIEVYPAEPKTFKELQEDVTSTSQLAVIAFNEAIVTGINGGQAYVVDKDGYGALIYESGHGFEVGDKITGTTDGAFVLFQGKTEITGITSASEGLTITKENTVPVTETTIDKITLKEQSSVVTLKNLTLDASSTNKATYLTDGTNKIQVYDAFKITLPEFSDEMTYSVTGVVVWYNTTLEIAPRSAADIVGVPTSINGITTDAADENAPIYNLAGQRVNKNAKGILIQNGKKFVNK